MSLLSSAIVHTTAEDLNAIQNPEIGGAGSGSVIGTVTYNTGKFDNGSETGAGTGSGIAYTRAGVNINPDAFLCSFWLKTPWSITNGVPSDALSHRVWDWYANNNNRVTIQIFASQLQFAAVVGGGFILPSFTTNITWSASTLVFFQTVWDRLGIDGGAETLRFYIDGSKVASSSLTIATQGTAGGNTHFQNIQFSSSLQNNFLGIQDNIKLYDNPTEQLILDDYNNRNIEGFGGVKLLDGGLNNPLLDGVLI